MSIEALLTELVGAVNGLTKAVKELTETASSGATVTQSIKSAEGSDDKKEEKSEPKPKRKRRTKAEIEADEKAAKKKVEEHSEEESDENSDEDSTPGSKSTSVFDDEDDDLGLGDEDEGEEEITRDMLKEKLIALSKADSKSACKRLLVKYKAETLPDVKEKDYQALYSDIVEAIEELDD